MRAGFLLPLLLLAPLLGLGLSGCKGKADGARPKTGEGAVAQGPAPFQAEVAHLKAGWIARFAGDKGAFDRLTKTSAGWAKYYKGELRNAAASLAASLAKGGDAPTQAVLRVGLGRTRFETGDLLRRSGDLHLRFLREYFEGRARRRPADRPAKPSERLYHGVALLLSGRPADAAPHLDAVVAAGAEAGVYAAQAKAWQGYATKLAGGDPAASWTEAAKGGPEAADLATYLKARTGSPPAAPLTGGGPMRDRLKVGVEVYRGALQEAEDAAADIDPKAPDQTDEIPALAGEAGAGEAQLRYFSPTFLDDLGRANLEQARAALDGVGGCADYWLGRALEALGRGGEAAAAYARLKAAPAAGAPAPPDPTACVAFSAYQEEADLAFDAGLRVAAMKGERRPLEATDERLIRRAWRLRAALPAGSGRELSKAALAPLAGVPDDPVPLQAAVDEVLDSLDSPEGVGLARKLRLDVWYGNAVLRAKAEVAARVGEFPLALSLLEASHDNQHSDEPSSVNRLGYLLETGVVNWEVKRRRRAIEHVRWLSGRFPELWQNNEFMRRVDAIEAVGDRSAPLQGN